MGLVFSLLLVVHILAFIAGGSNSVVGPIIGARIATAEPGMRAGYFSVMDAMSKVGKVSMVALLVTGPAMLFVRYGGLAGANVWFWVKMALIVVMLAAIIYGGIQFKKFEGGDAAAGRTAETAHKITGVAFLGVIIAAVLAFN